MMPGSNIPLDADATSLAAAQANQLASSTVMVAQLNGNLKTIFLTAFGNWKISVDAGRLPNTNPPHPPLGYVVSSPDPNGFQWPVLGTTPVCDMPPLPDDHFTPLAKVPNTFDVGHHIGGNWYSVGPQDTQAPGFTTPPGTQSGDVPPVIGIFEKNAAPVGAGWYLKVG